jgi:hypothetical protein
LRHGAVSETDQPGGSSIVQRTMVDCNPNHARIRLPCLIFLINHFPASWIMGFTDAG